MGVTGNPIALTITWSFALFPDANAGILHQVKFSLARTSFWFQHRTTRRIVSRECILRGSPQCSCSGANGGAPWSSAGTCTSCERHHWPRPRFWACLQKGTEKEPINYTPRNDLAKAGASE